MLAAERSPRPERQRKAEFHAQDPPPQHPPTEPSRDVGKASPPPGPGVGVVTWAPRGFLPLARSHGCPLASLCLSSMFQTLSRRASSRITVLGMEQGPNRRALPPADAWACRPVPRVGSPWGPGWSLWVWLTQFAGRGRGGSGLRSGAQAAGRLGGGKPGLEGFCAALTAGRVQAL